jgi:formylglycine-generating enzyme required for sulfatase activity
MTGNVWEWMEDINDSRRVLRVGAWSNDPALLPCLVPLFQWQGTRSSFREHYKLKLWIIPKAGSFAEVL